MSEEGKVLTAEQRIALVDGAAALEYRVSRLRELRGSGGEIGERRIREYEQSAKVLREMLVRDPSNWVAPS